MDRRTFMLNSAWLSSAAAGGAWPSLADADARRHTLAIVDTSLAPGLAFAEYANRLKLSLFEPGDDIGALWYTTLAPLLDNQTSLRTQPSLIGLTRASDYFVLRQLATRAGYRLDAHREQSKGSISPFAAHVAFVFAARPQR